MSDTPINPSPVLIDNTSRIVRDDLAQTIRAGGKVAVAAAYFSIYAFEALKEQLEQVDQFRFLFTSPTFTSVKPDRAMREF
ncbi:MAG: hypothetical protein IKE64_04410, partial [Thermoguttaceae bacterium]|nr:hypothetical protein [Thermoguttaceae bacterium]